MDDERKRPTALTMDLLIREILFSFFRLNATGERLFAGIGQTPGKVSLMRSLLEQGPQSVAQIARVRPVARQAVQLFDCRTGFAFGFRLSRGSANRAAVSVLVEHQPEPGLPTIPHRKAGAQVTAHIRPRSLPDWLTII